MALQTCGCTAAGCGCCDGTMPLTPARVWNRAGLDAVRDRVGTHGAFLETMKSRIATLRVQAPGADGQTIESFQPLRALTTRDPADPAIALLDGWATIADVLTFYQERLTNEFYLRTATERGSLVSLGRTVGYAPRPGVAASTFLWYDIDDKQAEPVVLPPGTRAQSIPGPGEFPQSFETAEAVEARAEWNALPVRKTRPQAITLAAALALDRVHLAGGSLNLKTGDTLLFAFGTAGAVVRSIAAVEVAFGDNRTVARLVPLPGLVAPAAPLLVAFVAAARAALPKGSGGKGDEGDGAAERMVTAAAELANDVLLGLPSDATTWPATIENADDDDPGSAVTELIADLKAAIEALAADAAKPPAPPVLASPDSFVAPLLKPPAAQPASAQRLGRDLKTSFGAGRDTTPQLLLDVVPALRGAFYTAWSNAAVATAAAPLQALHVFRGVAAPFGASAGAVPSYNATTAQLEPPDQWGDWTIREEDGKTVLFLDQPNDTILPGSFVLVARSAAYSAKRSLLPVLATAPASRTAYGLSGKTTALTLGDAWLPEDQRSMSLLRSTALRVQSEALTLAEAPIEAPIASATIELAGLHKALQPGRWLVISGERTDIPGVAGVPGRELAMLSGLTHGYDPLLPGDVTRTTLILAAPPAYAYRRDTVVISANVAQATHGETRLETLGAGDATQPFQTFELKQPPLTFTPEISAAGVRSTLKVLVDEVEWTAVPSLVGQGPRDRVFVTRIADDGRVTVTFGDGVTGARPPTGVENIRAVYRQGIGAPGNVREAQIALLLSRPAGVRGVVNPLPATGGADPDAATTIRDHVPLAVTALDRLVSLADYADFARGFAGIAKADALVLSDGARRLVHVTIAGVDDIPIATNSGLHAALVGAMQALGDPALPLVVAPRERVTLVLAAKLKLLAGYQWESVVGRVRAVLLDRFGFARRALAQPIYLSEVQAAIQGVAGIDYADIDSFGGVPERVAADGARRLLTLDEIAKVVAGIADPQPASTLSQGIPPPPAGPPRIVAARPAALEDGALRPAQLAVFTAAVPDTIVLNQIL